MLLVLATCTARVAAVSLTMLLVLGTTNVAATSLTTLLELVTIHVAAGSQLITTLLGLLRRMK